MKRKLQLLNLFKANAKRGSFRAEGNTIYIYDMIVASEFEAEFFGGVYPMQIVEQLKNMSGDVLVRIDSPGGDVFAAVNICQHLREYSGKVTAQIDGVAASAASVIACSVDEVVMAKGSMMMIHQASTMAMGNSGDFLAVAELLEKVDGQIANVYAEKTGKDAADFMAAMEKETWYTETGAVEAGLANRVYEPEKKTKNILWDLTAFEHAPKIAQSPADPELPVDNSTEESEHRARQLKVRLLQKAA